MRQHTTLAAFAALLLSLLALSGCLEIRTMQYFNENGTSHVTQQIGVGGLLRVLNSTAFPYQNSTEPGAWEKAFDRACANVGKFESGATCRRTGNWYVVDQNRISGKDYVISSYFEFPYVIHDLYVVRPPPIPTDIFAETSLVRMENLESFANASQIEAAALKKAGIKYTYLARLPGEVFSTTAGIITPEGVEIDALEQASQRQLVRIQSREYDFGQIALAAIFWLDIILAVDVIAIYGVGWLRRNQDKVNRVKEEANARMREARNAERRKKLTGYKVYSVDDEGPVSRLGEEDAQKDKKK